MTRTLLMIFLCLAAWAGIALAEDAIHRPSRPTMIFEPTADARPDLPATRPTTRPSRTAARIPDAPLPLMPVRKAAVAFAEQRALLTVTRQPIDPPALFAVADPPRPGQPLLPAAPPHAAPTVYEPWLPLPYLMKLRLESPVRAHEPVADPTGGSTMRVLPVFRSTPLAAQRNLIPDPFENVEAVKLDDPPADDDPPGQAATWPALPLMALEKVTLPIPPATRPATQPTTRP